MAISKTFSIFSILSLIVFSIFSSLTLAEDSHFFHKTISPTLIGLNKEKLSHLHFYFHDILSGPKPTAVNVAQAQMTNKSPTGFGMVMMADDPLTSGPEPDSKLVGKAQGIYASAAQDQIPIVGGSGLFKFARGYAHAKTHTFDLKTGNAIVEYNVYVFHY
ncbi:hypothetical protein TanjilG_06930 [Lupinus angustifolius]|uniref:Dirigent protein n=1 Tax=Lupinus angustifolius TaxID=3871 RepID=A0A4P1QV38_LUPAN|nr:hypothetical protein TanjilG_06930 [Lupinus angustifolius]